MRLPAYLIAFVLAVLLAATTPIGAGAGVHEFDLLHPLFSHLHLVNGRWLTHAQMASLAQGEATNPPSGVSLGNGSVSDGGGVGVSPTVPVQPFEEVLAAGAEWVILDTLVPEGRSEAPPDPPPL